MTQEDWGARIAHSVGAEVRRHRQERGWSAERLAAACEAAGMEIPRSVLANLENQRRASVSVAEVLVLAKALGVPPIVLIFPIGHAETFETFPGQMEDTWTSRNWFAGERPVENPDIYMLVSRGCSQDDGAARMAAYRSAAYSADLYERHRVSLSELRNAMHEVKASEDVASEDEVVMRRRLAVARGEGLHLLRETMEFRGLVLPTLTPEVSRYVDEPEHGDSTWSQVIHGGTAVDGPDSGDRDVE